MKCKNCGCKSAKYMYPRTINSKTLFEKIKHTLFISPTEMVCGLCLLKGINRELKEMGYKGFEEELSNEAK